MLISNLKLGSDDWAHQRKWVINISHASFTLVCVPLSVCHGVLVWGSRERVFSASLCRSPSGPVNSGEWLLCCVARTLYDTLLIKFKDIVFLFKFNCFIPYNLIILFFVLFHNFNYLKYLALASILLFNLSV